MSHVTENLFMEWPEQQSIHTVPVSYKPKLWKIYVDDVMDVVRNGGEQGLTYHPNIWNSLDEHTRQKHKVSDSRAITNHADRNRCIIDWDGAKVIDRESNRNARWPKETMWIRETTPVMN